MERKADYLKNLRSESVVQRVINCLTDAIITRELKPGDRIPTEPEMAETMGVARSSIREATKILTYLGVLENRRSGGTYVASGFQESMIDPMVYGVLILNQGDDAQNLIELRQLMEVGMLRLAIQKQNADGLAHLKERLLTMEQIVLQGGDGIVEKMFQADNDFHDTVSALCQNPLAEKINRVVRVLTHAVRYRTVETMIVTGRVEELIQAHWRIYHALQEKNTEHLDAIIRETYFLEVGEQPDG